MTVYLSEYWKSTNSPFTLTFKYSNRTPRETVAIHNKMWGNVKSIKSNILIYFTTGEYFPAPAFWKQYSSRHEIWSSCKKSFLNLDTQNITDYNGDDTYMFSLFNEDKFYMMNIYSSATHMSNRHK